MASINVIDYTEKAIKQPDGTTRRVRVKLKDKRDWRYEVRYRDPNGRVRRKRFPLKGDAERWLQRNGADIQRDEWTAPEARRVLIDEWINRYVETQIPKRAPTTQRGYLSMIDKYIRPYFGGRPIRSIDYQDVEDFIAWMRTEHGVGPKRQRDTVSVLSLVFRLALKSRAVKENPAREHELERTKSDQAQIAPLVQLLRLVLAMPDVYQVPTLLLVHTGIRPSEMCGLRIENTNVEKGLLYIKETLQPLQGYEELVRGPTKNGQPRVVNLPPFLSEEIGLYLARRVQKRGRPLTPDEPTFVNTQGQPINRATYSQVLKRRLKAVGLPENFRTYDLRHSHASILIDRGHDPVAVQNRLGHSDVATTLRNYVHLFDSLQERLVAQLEDLHAEAMAAIGEGPEVVELSDPRKDERRRDREQRRATG